ncbi:MAG: hypothetical protein KA712_23220 [Myxococcales bacterium]|nr:hypothetical protein [Myxococcales bacterium]
MSWDRHLSWVKDVGVERTRRTVAQLALAVFGILYALLGLLLDPSWRAAFLALGLCYLVAFFAVGSEWFWGRWYAQGLGWSGFMVGVFSLVNVGWVAPLVIYTALHGVVVFSLRGTKVAALYEGQSAWRERYGMDDHAVSRLGKTITRTSASLPALVVWALGPKEPQGAVWGGPGGSWIAMAALAVAGLSLVLLLRLRSAGALGVMMAAVLATFAFWQPASALSTPWALIGTCARIVAPVALMAAVLPLVGPVACFLRGRSSARSPRR